MPDDKQRGDDLRRRSGIEDMPPWLVNVYRQWWLWGIAGASLFGVSFEPEVTDRWLPRVASAVATAIALALLRNLISERRQRSNRRG